MKNERSEQAHKLRQEGKTFKEIGEHLGVSASRASQIVALQDRRNSRPATWMDELSSRTANCLKMERYTTKESVITALKNGQLADNKKLPNFGKKSLAELRAYFGLED